MSYGGGGYGGGGYGGGRGGGRGGGYGGGGGREEKARIGMRFMVLLYLGQTDVGMVFKLV